jgi:hypothetical protein
MQEMDCAMVTAGMVEPGNETKRSGRLTVLSTTHVYLLDYDMTADMEGVKSG